MIEPARPTVLAVSTTSNRSTDDACVQPIDQFERTPMRGLSGTNTDAAIFAKMTDGVVEGEFYFDAPRVAAVFASMMTGCVHQTTLALYGTAGSLAQASTQALSTGVHDASVGAVTAVWSASTWPLRRIAHMFAFGTNTNANTNPSTTVGTKKVHLIAPD